MAAVLYRSVSCNIQNTDTAAQQAASLRKAWANAEVLKLNEGNEVSDAIRALDKDDADAYSPGGYVGQENRILWRHSIFELLDKGTKTIFPGGLGSPARGVVWVLLKHRASGKRVLEFNCHQIHQAFTSHPERQQAWFNIANGVSAEINRVMAKYPGVPMVFSGDMNRSGTWDWPGLDGVTKVMTPDSFGSLRYDRFFLKGGVVSHAATAVTTNSDHRAIVVRIEITADSAVPVPPAPTPPVNVPTTGDFGNDADVPGKNPPVFPDVEASRRQATYRARPRWRFFAQRIDGDGADGQILHHELPLQSPQIEDVLTGHNSLSGTISPELGSLIADDGRPLLEEWGTAIWAEESGNIHGGGILTKSGFSGPEWQITCTGLTGYLVDLPYADAHFFVETDPLDILRHIWAHVQSQPGSNLGLELDATKTDRKIGKTLTQGEFDSQSGPLVFEDGPYKLAWYQDHDLASNADNLASDTPFDWHEEHYWQGDVLKHRLRLGYPNLGSKRNDLRFVIGENVHIIPDVDRDGDEYADEVWMLGAGEGSAMLRGVARANIKKLRRVAVLADPGLRHQASVDSAAQRELGFRSTLDNVTSIVVRDHPHADIGSLAVGDEIRLQGPTGWIDLDTWYRVVARRINPFSPDRMELDILRADRIAAGGEAR